MNTEAIENVLKGYTARTLTEKYGADSIKLIEDLKLLGYMRDGDPELPSGTMLQTSSGEAVVVVLDERYYIIMLNGYNRWADEPFHKGNNPPRLSDLTRKYDRLHVYGYVSGYEPQNNKLIIPVCDQQHYVSL